MVPVHKNGGTENVKKLQSSVVALSFCKGVRNCLFHHNSSFFLSIRLAFQNVALCVKGLQRQIEESLLSFVSPTLCQHELVDAEYFDISKAFHNFCSFGPHTQARILWHEYLTLFIVP